ncbi:MAG: AAA family ATPase [Thermoleophilia bacterium]|nr:AAA family ATPase [Thermoleophilia bacterium]
MILCSSCGSSNEPGRKFCGECGTGLTLGCPSCGAANAPGIKFCGECGTALAAASAPAAPQAPQAAPTAERRLVSVLFADLVGFTTVSEGRDAEDVRELLSRYFETARTIIERYGGTVEKFIGDAVMAVWGTPIAREDDAERSVRAALDLTAAVSSLGDEVGAHGLRARAGVLTGEAAVTLGAEDQGMVAGDLVNTASRIQSTAEPGQVLVGEATRRATEASVAYEEAGTHDLKGKAEPVELFRALRVTAGRQGSLRSAGLEAPFVGRDRELRLVKELFHASAEEAKAQLVTITGIAGIGKSRLSWEFEKYIDGLADDQFWHRGRCLSYGDGVAYFALAEMVRMRCDIAEDEDPATAREKLRATLAEHLSDPGERAWVEPRLAHLLGLEEGAAGDQENLFSAWRILFERLSEKSPTVLVFEDMQWADSGLLDFLEYLLEWSRSHPLFVLVLARPELADKRPAWGGGKRSFASIYLEPLSQPAMEELLTGLVPGLPEDVRTGVLARAEGVPLYAVETVRMLLDRGLLVREGNAYSPTGPIGELEVPETLHALIAARLDGLSVEERRLVQDGAVLGKTFTRLGLASLTGLAEADLEPLLGALVRKEVLAIQADPRSPERGQYAFLQDIVRHVAYETLSRRERKAKHLGAAQFLESLPSADEGEIVEVIATHYVDAWSAAPDDDDADAIRARALEMLVRAGERAASLAASSAAQHAYERAIELSDEPGVQADLHERAGLMAFEGARPDQAGTHFEDAIALFNEAGETHARARVEARLAQIMWDRGRLEEGLERMDRSYQELSQEEPDEDLAELAAQLGRFLFFAGRHDLAMDRIESALELAEGLALPETFSQALNTKAILLISHGRKLEGLSLLRYALEVALEHDKPSAALRGYFNLADSLSQADRYEEAEVCVRDGLAFSRRVGNRYQELLFLGQSYALFALGKWDEALEWAEDLPEDWMTARQAYSTVSSVCVTVLVHQGSLEEADRVATLLDEFASSADAQERAGHACGKSRLLLARGDAAEALQVAQVGVEMSEEMGLTQEYVKESLVNALEATLDLRDTARAEELLAIIENLPVGSRPQFLHAQALRFRARLTGLEGDADAERLFKRAVALFRELAMPFYLAVVELEHAEWLTAQSRGEDAAPLLEEARTIFGELNAAPWLERAEKIGVAEPMTA